MTVNGKLLYTLRASIDQPKAMFFAGRELEAGCSSVVRAGSSTTVTLLVNAQAIPSKMRNLIAGKCYGSEFLREDQKEDILARRHIWAVEIVLSVDKIIIWCWNLGTVRVSQEESKKTRTPLDITTSTSER
jgi:hypothetical protein